ncbi:MAG TPA: HD domain-containing phosphohydrolase, partial [Phycisphaerae bacterium]|nr:HD domain-containing phosphohydrolase [Phycisphaerae bacterium]
RHLEPEVVAEWGDERHPAYVRVPLTAYGELIGVVVAAVENADCELSHRQRTVLSALGTIGATALRTCGVFAQQEERWVGLIAALCRAVHSMDAFKREHARRVADIAVVLARALGQQDRDALQLIRVAGIVHDIGKVALPPQLFKKKGRLRNSERQQMQQHCELGADLLSEVPQLQRLSQIVLHHHEHFDGGGYPGGLAGSEIPIESRIIAVADAYDAMTNERPFRAAMSHGEAIRRIREAAMTQFDPSVVKVFLDLFESEQHRDLLLAASFQDVANWTPNPKTPAVSESLGLVTNPQ